MSVILHTIIQVLDYYRKQNFIKFSNLCFTHFLQIFTYLYLVTTTFIKKIVKYIE